MAEQVVSIAMQDGQLSVKDAVKAYLDYQTSKGNRTGSVTTSGHVLRRFFGSFLDSPLHKITPQRGADLYEKLRTGRGERTGEAISASTHRGNLSQAKTFLSWCVERGWLRSNPLDKVKPVGQKRHGKPQLTINEARLLYGVCLREAERDDGALAVLLAGRPKDTAEALQAAGIDLFVQLGGDAVALLGDLLTRLEVRG